MADTEKKVDGLSVDPVSNQPLGQFEYTFFVDGASSSDYQFTVPLHVAASGSNTSPPPATEITKYTAPKAPVVALGETEKQITDSSGAVMTYPLWQILPASVSYMNGTQVKFDYDTNGDVVKITEQPGAEWIRGAVVDKDFRRWDRSDGKTFSMNAVVLPDGNYQMIHQNGNVYSFTTAGKMLLSKPFSPKFDIGQSLVRVFKQLDPTNTDVLTKADLDRGVIFTWKNADDAQLVAMLKQHFELIQIVRDKAILKLGRGLSEDDILHYDTLMRKVFSQEPPAASMKMIEELFDKVDSDNDSNVSITEFRERAKMEDFSPAQRVSLNYIMTHTEQLHAYTPSGYINRTERMTRTDFIEHYKNVYRDQVGKYASAGGWGIEKVWRKTMDAKRTLYADAQNPVASLRVEAIQQGRVGDCLFLAALASVIAVRPGVITKMIRENENGTFTVSFPGGTDFPISLAAPTSSELALYAKGSEYGIWAPLLERAYGMLVAKRRNLSAVIPAENTATRENMKSLEILTGNSSRWEFTQDHFSRAFGNCKRTVDETQMREILTRCFARKLALTAAALKGSEAKGTLPMIVSMHAYSIIGWDLKRDEVVMRNPWGVIPLNASSMDLFKFEQGHKIVDDNTNGKFKLSFADFYSKFEAICIETPAEFAR